MPDQIQSIALQLLKRNPSEFARSLDPLIRNGEWAKLQELKLNPRVYGLDAESYWRDAMCLDLLRKCKLPTTVDTEMAAIENFWALERHNAQTNARLNRYVLKSSLESQDLPVIDFLDQWRKNNLQVLGCFPTQIEPRFSGGATVGDVGKLKTIPDKMSSVPQWYQRSSTLWENEWRLTSWHRARVVAGDPYPSTTRANVFFTVPKDGTKDRGCCKEASVSLSYQLGLALVVRRRLRRWGIDIESGQDRHKELACAASLTGDFATIDLSDASDRWSRKAVALGLGPQSDWYLAFNSLRAPATLIQGKTVFLEKFSSMGNGFTFELETLLFAGLARTVVEMEGGDPDQVSCFGDDLIVPSRHAESVLGALKFLGHVPNLRKTFTSGVFRESCGGDFIFGTAVRTVKLEEVPKEPQQWISLCNQLRAVCIDDPRRWAMVKPVWEKALRQIPNQIRACRGPSDLGDLVIHDSPEYWTVRGKGFRASVRGYSPVTTRIPWKHWKPEVQLACVTLCSSEGVTPRDAIAGYRLKWLRLYRNHWLPS